MRHSHGVAAGVLLAASLLVAPVSAQSLLDGLTDQVESLVTLESGEAGTSGAVNAGIGGGNGNVLDLNVLPGSGGSIADATVGTGGDNAVDARVRLLNDTVRVNAGVGGDSLVAIGAEVGDTEVGGGGTVTPGTPGVPGGINGGDAATRMAAACAGQDASGVASLVASTDLSQAAQWQNARGIEIVPVQFCRDILNQLRGLAQASNIGFLQNIVASDALLSAALSRNSKSVSDVLAVEYSNRMLTVYVL